MTKEKAEQISRKIVEIIQSAISDANADSNDSMAGYGTINLETELTELLQSI